ncbi:unnamed protein product [Protopolystoma xenopodis]|uniref:PDZ domain-containing protein n=1 Tax=Protopolystoma xenopodis TaxID=117903 RepID=A0A3S5FFM6_9PLAT|nr:unnamed protein product [Protopolystoma xenopodis]
MSDWSFPDVSSSRSQSERRRVHHLIQVDSSDADNDLLATEYPASRSPHQGLPERKFPFGSKSTAAVNHGGFSSVTTTESTSRAVTLRRPRPVARLEPNTLFIEVVLQRGTSAGLGFSIAGGVGNEHIDDDSGIFITKITSGGVADTDGRISVGDRLVQVNDKPLVGITHEYAVDVLRGAGDRVHLFLVKPSPKLWKAMGSATRELDAQETWTGSTSARGASLSTGFSTGASGTGVVSLDPASLEANDRDSGGDEGVGLSGDIGVADLGHRDPKEYETKEMHMLEQRREEEKLSVD